MAADEAPPVLVCYADRRSTAEAVARRYLQHLESWEAAGYPSLDGIRLRVYPQTGADPSPQPAALLAKRWSRIAVDWP